VNYKKARKLSNIFAFTGVGLIFLTLFLEDIVALLLILGTIGLILVGIGAVITYVNYRCPHCQYMLPTRTYSVPTFCSHCGKELDSKHE
jgi:hypothetical protein